MPLLVPGSPRTCSLVGVGTPPGSPLSPLLLVINVAPLHILLDRGLLFYDVHDISLTFASPFYGSDRSSLQAAFRQIRAIADSRKVDLSLSKTELIHLRTPLQRDPRVRPPTPCGPGWPDLPPLQEARPAAYWFVLNLPCAAHVS